MDDRVRERALEMNRRAIALSQRAFDAARADPSTRAALHDLLQALDPEARVAMTAALAGSSAQSRPTAYVLRSTDPNIQALYDRYILVRKKAYVRALDAGRLAAGERSFTVLLGVVDQSNVPAAGVLFRMPDQPSHEVLVLRRDEVTSTRIRDALSFARLVWAAHGITPDAPVALEVKRETAETSDTSAGVTHAMIESAIDELAKSREMTMVPSFGRVRIVGIHVALPDLPH